MPYNPSLHHRRSIRLKGYDYSQAGSYFITICVKDRAHLYSIIENGKMILNDAGEMINKWWQKIPEKFPDIELAAYQIMPNHFHAIIINNGPGITAAAAVRADPCVCPLMIGDDADAETIWGEHNFDDTKSGEHVGSPLQDILQWFKTMTTNEYIRGVKNLGWTRFNGKLWQRNYWEHIIRDEQSYNRISDYIINNPAKWLDDKFYMQ